MISSWWPPRLTGDIHAKYDQQLDLDLCIHFYTGCFFYWSALKNDYVSDYLMNPIKKFLVPEFPKGLALGQFWPKTFGADQ